MEEGIRTIEHLHHFQCPHCFKWFSIGDAPQDRKQWSCPWCGRKASYEQKNVQRPDPHG